MIKYSFGGSRLEVTIVKGNPYSNITFVFFKKGGHGMFFNKKHMPFFSDISTSERCRKKDLLGFQKKYKKYLKLEKKNLKQLKQMYMYVK